MRPEKIIFFFALAVLLAGVFIHDILAGAPDINIIPCFWGLPFIFTSGIFDRRISLAAAGAVSLLPWPLLVFFNMIVWQTALFSSVLVWMSFLIGYMMDRDKRKNIEREKEIKRKKEALESIRSESMMKMQEEDEKIDGEIRNIISLYSAVKDLGQSMRLEESAGIIMAIMKKIMRYNFKADMDEISLLLILKKGKAFAVVDSFGYEQEFLEQAEKKLVSTILRSVAKGKGVVYKSGPDKGELSRLSFIKSFMFIPFYAEKKLLGAMFLSGGRENMFDQKQVESMEILANQIAIALEKVYLYHKVQKMSIMDGLTGLYVHRYMQEKLDNELKRASRYGNNLSLIIGDIDYFKDINDTYGHIAGDYILKNIALLLKNSTSPVDTVARYGGEEFVVIMPEADKENAADTAEKIRREIEKYPFRFGDNDIKVTMSFGVGSFPGDAMVKRSLIEKADAALYKAKESGRNKVITA